MQHVFSAEILDRVRRATVRIATKDRGHGQGVLIPGGYILTAAHCVDWDHTGSMVLGDYYVQTITDADGEDYLVSPVAVEPCFDIAILSSVDGQASEEFGEAWEAFEEFCESTRAVEPLFDPLPLEEPQNALVLSHRGIWIPATATQYRFASFGSFALAPSERIEGGTSGGPIVVADGRLLGVVSSAPEAVSSDPEVIVPFTPFAAATPRITALPYWAVELIRGASGTEE